MTKEYNAVLEARKSMKAQIAFFETLLQHLKGTDKVLRDNAMWTAWCLHHYINDHLIKDVLEAIRLYAPKEGENVQ